MSTDKRPPRGLKPRYIHDEERAREISEALTRAFQGNTKPKGKILALWAEELLEICARLAALEGRNPKGGHAITVPGNRDSWDSAPPYSFGERRIAREPLTGVRYVTNSVEENPDDPD